MPHFQCISAFRNKKKPQVDVYIQKQKQNLRACPFRQRPAENPGPYRFPPAGRGSWDGATFLVPLVSFLSLASSFLRSLQAREHPDARSRVTVGNMTMHQECCQHRLVIRDVYGSLCLDYRGCRAPKITWLLILASLFPGFFLRNGMVSSGR